jgi:hypothetical protein
MVKTGLIERLGVYNGESPTAQDNVMSVEMEWTGHKCAASELLAEEETGLSNRCKLFVQ